MQLSATLLLQGLTVTMKWDKFLTVAQFSGLWNRKQPVSSAMLLVFKS
jgi:hypothetical protein